VQIGWYDFSVCWQFEYQQAQLEREIENLSWKIERAENTSRGVIIELTYGHSWFQL
jgi:proline dehydrogenase